MFKTVKNVSLVAVFGYRTVKSVRTLRKDMLTDKKKKSRKSNKK